MRKIKPLLWGAMLLGVWFLSSSDIAPKQYGGWTPYFMQRSELERSVFLAGKSRQMNNPGKIWVADNTIYVVERYKGVHVIDNSNPANPFGRDFIVAPGCMDVAVKGNILYLDNAVDLVAFDLTTDAVTERIKNYFAEPVSPNGDVYRRGSGDIILVGWKKANEEGRPWE
jgi:hypothetical protein